MALLKRISVLVAVAAVLTASVAAQTTAPSPAAPSSPLDEAKALISKGKYAEAIPVLEIIASSDKTSAPQALKMMGDCYKIQKNWSQALKCFEKILTYPDQPLSAKDVRTWIMDCYFADSHYSGYRLLDELIETYPDHVGEFYYVVGRRHHWMHRYPAAVEYLGKAIEALPIPHPDAQDAAQRYILCALTSGDFDKVLTYLPTYIKRYPEQIPNIIAGQMYR